MNSSLRPTTSQSTTNKKVIYNNPPVHLRTIRNNTPVIIDPIVQTPVTLPAPGPNILTQEEDEHYCRSHPRPPSSPPGIHLSSRDRNLSHRACPINIEYNIPSRRPDPQINKNVQQLQRSQCMSHPLQDLIAELLHQNIISQEETSAENTHSRRSNQHRANNIYHMQHIDTTAPSPTIPMYNAVVHPVTKETITKYKKLANDPVTAKVWKNAFCHKLGRLPQGYNTTKGTNIIRFMTHNMIKNIPRDRTVTYTRIIVDYQPQKADPNWVRITAGGNLIEYSDELTTQTTDLITTKIM